MPMGPAETVASLKELCEQAGPRISTEQIVRWIETRGGYDNEAALIAFAKKMKARQFARMLVYEDKESGMRVKRLWSFRDRVTGERYYQDLLQMPEARRRRLLQQYSRFLEQMRTVKQAMADYFAGQQFMGFFVEDDEDAKPEKPFKLVGAAS